MENLPIIEWCIIESRTEFFCFFPNNAGNILKLSSAAPSGIGKSNRVAKVANRSTKHKGS